MYRVSRYVICEEECMLEGNSLNTHTRTHTYLSEMAHIRKFSYVCMDIF